MDDVVIAVSYTHLRAHETDSYLVCRLLLEKIKQNIFPFPLEVTEVDACKLVAKDIIKQFNNIDICVFGTCLLYTSPSPRDGLLSRMPSSA